MRLSEVKEQLKKQGALDSRELVSYATLSGTALGSPFQNLVAAVFGETALTLYHANIDGSIGAILVQIPYGTISRFTQKHRFLYSYTAFTADSGDYRFLSYDKKVFLTGFTHAGLTGKAL